MAIRSSTSAAEKFKKITSALIIVSGLGVLIACGGGGGSASSASTATNLFGNIDPVGTGGSGVVALFRKTASRLHILTASNFAGCTVNAYNINDNAVIATGTSDSVGNFTITGGSLVSGTTYKIVSTCPDGSSLTSLIGANNVAPANESPTSVDPLTTLITTQVVKAIVSAVTNAIAASTAAIAGLTADQQAAVQLSIVNSLLSPQSLNGLVSAVSTAVQTAVSTGSMLLPDPTSASAMAGAAQTAQATSTTQSSTVALTTVTTNYTTQTGGTGVVPPTVSNTVSSATQSAAAFPACDSSLNQNGIVVASPTLCTQAVAKLMYSVVHFDIALVTDGTGAFGAATCGDATMLAAFPNAQFTAGNETVTANVLSQTGNHLPTNVCGIHDPTPSLDRNQNYGSNSGNNGHNGPTFIENCAHTVCGGTADLVGVLSAIGASLYAKNSYHLSDLDNIVFSYNNTSYPMGRQTGGLNARLIYMKPSYSWTNPNGAMNWNYFSASYNLLTAGTPNTYTVYNSWPTGCNGNSGPCEPGKLGQFTSGDWASDGGAHAAVTAAIGASTFTGSVFTKQFAGPIPSADGLQQNIVNSTTHNDYNRSGQSTFFVLYSKQPDYNNPNCQWNGGPPPATDYVVPGTSTTVTSCTAMDGTVAPAITVDIATGTPDGSGISQIKSITTPTSGTATGRYYIYQQQGGLVQFIDSQTGRIMADESLAQRSVQFITNTSQCSLTNDGGCALNKMYNVTSSWNCSSQPCTLSVSATTTQKNTAAINTGALPAKAGSPPVARPNITDDAYYTPNVQFQANVVWSQTPGGPSYVAANSSTPSFNPPSSIVVVTVNAGTGAISTSTTQPAGYTLGGSEYQIAPMWDCSTQPCKQVGYNLVAVDGSLYAANKNGGGFNLAANPPTGFGPATQQTCVVPGNPCTMGNAVVYTDAYLQSLAATTFHYSDSGTGAWNAVARNPVVYMGPASNPTFDCALDPFFISNGTATNNQGYIDVVADSSPIGHHCSNTTFGNPQQAAQWIWGNGMSVGSPGYVAPHAGANISVNQHNYYQFGDAKSVMGLMNAAFGPWMDGTHTLDGSTNLNALQGFGLIYILMSQGSQYGTHISGILPNDSQGHEQASFAIVTPACDGDNGVVLCNAVIGNGMANYHQ